jgi:hypothetical protein
MHTAGQFMPITLGELGDAALMQRVERKFVVPVGRLADLLARCTTEYRMLEVDGVRLNRYSTRYFDTPDLGLYHAHHAGRVPRAKIRVREYLDSGQRYVEVKRRLNTMRTNKARVHLNGSGAHPLDVVRTLPAYADSGLAQQTDLREVLVVSFTRVTLVRRSAAERVTVDVDVEASMGARVVRYPGVAFVEVKQVRAGASPVIDALRLVRARRGAISKYCLGVVALVEQAKKNRFKEAVAVLHRTTTDSGITHVA